MLLAIDVGNTQTVIGLYGEDDRSHELADHWRVATKAERTSDEHALLIQEFLIQTAMRYFGLADSISSTISCCIRAAYGCGSSSG